jgi:hypothetical protein
MPVWIILLLLLPLLLLLHFKICCVCDTESDTRVERDFCQWWTGLRDELNYIRVCLDGLKEATDKSVRILGLQVEIWTWYLVNMKQKYWPTPWHQWWPWKQFHKQSQNQFPLLTALYLGTVKFCYSMVNIHDYGIVCPMGSYHISFLFIGGYTYVSGD